MLGTDVPGQHQDNLTQNFLKNALVFIIPKIGPKPPWALPDLGYLNDYVPKLSNYI